MRRRADDMILNEKILKGLERSYRKAFPGDLSKYLLVKYGEEPFPYEFTEQDLYENIRRDICNYEAGELDVTVKTRSEYLREELEHLKGLYIERLDEIRDLRDYIKELEHMLSEHGLESSRMADERPKTRSSEI
jgi:hypothetical protein